MSNLIPLVNKTVAGIIDVGAVAVCTTITISTTNNEWKIVVVYISLYVDWLFSALIMAMHRVQFSFFFHLFRAFNALTVDALLCWSSASPLITVRLCRALYSPSSADAFCIASRTAMSHCIAVCSSLALLHCKPRYIISHLFMMRAEKKWREYHEQKRTFNRLQELRKRRKERRKRERER